MFLKTIVRIGKLCWGLPIVIMALIFTGLVMVITYFGTVIWEHLIRRWSNPFIYAPRVWLGVLRHLFFRWACIRIYTENACAPFEPGDRVVAGGNHGSHISMWVAEWASAAYLPNPVRWVIKIQATEWWQYGRVLKKIGLAWPIDRDKGDEAICALESMGEGFEDGTAKILIDGSRPTLAGIAAGQQYYRDKGQAERAERLKYTCRPRPGGFRTILNTVPHERVVRVLVTSSVHEEGFWGLVDLMFTGAIFVRLEDWVEPLHPREPVFVDEVTEVWLGYVQDWIGAKRALWATRHSR